MEGGSTFTMGKGFGQMLQRIAWEKLTEKYNPREAVEIITKPLLGCTEGMAVDILDGKIILGEDEATGRTASAPRFSSRPSRTPSTIRRSGLWRNSRTGR